MSQDKIESRRAFMKKLGRLTGLAAAAAFLAAGSNNANARAIDDARKIAEAKSIEDKTGTVDCDNSCLATCTGSCIRTCTGSCHDTCLSACDNTCYYGCDDNCYYKCDNTCRGSCRGECMFACTITCYVTSSSSKYRY